MFPQNDQRHWGIPPAYGAFWWAEILLAIFWRDCPETYLNLSQVYWNCKDGEIVLGSETIFLPPPPHWKKKRWPSLPMALALNHQRRRWIAPVCVSDEQKSCKQPSDVTAAGYLHIANQIANIVSRWPSHTFRLCLISVASCLRTVLRLLSLIKRFYLKFS